MSGKSASKKGSAVAKMTLSEVSGVVFPVGRMHRYLRRQRVASRVGKGGAVYMAAVLEYLAAEVVEMGGNAAKDKKKTRITPRDLMIAIRNDDELNPLFRGVTLPFSGTLPFIHKALLVDKKMKKKAAAMGEAAAKREAERNAGSAERLAEYEARVAAANADSPEV